MKTKKWQYSGDVNMLDYGGKNMRHTHARQYQIVELINFLEATGELLNEEHKYCVELKLVDLDAIPEKEKRSALSCCGCERMENPSDDILAECCDTYGVHAPLGSWSGNNARKLLRSAYRRANELLEPDTLEEQLERPVNKIGSTAREFMSGDLFSAVQRGCESGNVDARIMAKMHGIPQQAIDDTRPDDYLPYVFGYMAGMSGGTKETDPDTSPEYFRGYDRALNVKAGKCPVPGWIQETKQTV